MSDERRAPLEMTPDQALQELARVPVSALIGMLRRGRLNRLAIGGRVVPDHDATALLMSIAADRMERMAADISAYEITMHRIAEAE
jgi:hypothetical protein